MSRIIMTLASMLLVGASTGACSDSSRSGAHEQAAKKAAANTKTGNDAGAMPDAAGTAAACDWPARLDRGDAAPRGACQASRHLLSCALAGGATAVCLSDEAQCPNSGAASCEDQCKPNEYAIACGAVGPDPGMPDPPPACHDPSYTPAGSFFMCCPCE